MLNNFKRVFGNEKDVVACFGDYEQKKQMKFKEATKGKGMRTLFRKAGFQAYLVDEDTINQDDDSTGCIDRDITL